MSRDPFPAFSEKADAAIRRRQDLAIAVDLIVRYVGPIDDLIAALDGSGATPRLLRALRTELARRRRGVR